MNLTIEPDLTTHTSTQRKYTEYVIHTPRFIERSQPATTRANTIRRIQHQMNRLTVYSYLTRYCDRHARFGRLFTELLPENLGTQKA